MQVEKQVIRVLNQALGQALIAINQYFLHARVVKNWGIDELNEHLYKQSIHEMKWADDLIERILMLGGLPNLQELGKLLIGENVAEILACDLKLEYQKTTILQHAIAVCETHEDYVSRKLLVKLKDGSEEHIDWLETQQELINNVGIENYIQSQLEDD
ncbi:bacterioferritin [Moraxella macacae 0408225]|uniref:Bacterioferritin n=1 Tax=Moraxella macacae 0408225 TaxID=1230338 RepID=L2F893_9GAMM|nr:bacterioferritin [Moraxella macacae]ELA08683.1 bacterioferritin [Moraxella macacae 0408225]